MELESFSLQYVNAHWLLGETHHELLVVEPVKSADRLRRLGHVKNVQTRMWANAQRDGRPAEHRWHPLFNSAKFG